MKTKKAFIFIILLISYSFFFQASSQAPDSLWTIHFGEDEYSEEARAVVEVSDGFVIAGSIDKNTTNQTDIYLLKVDLSGNKVWSRSYGGGARDHAYDLKQTNDGGFVVLGSGWDQEEIEDKIWLLKIDSEGDTLWTKHFGGYDDTGLGSETAYCVQQTTDNGYIITGVYQPPGVGPGYELYLIKTDEYGELKWEKTYGDTYHNYGHSVQQTIDGGYIIAGHTYRDNSGDDCDIWLVKVDSEGGFTWSETYSFPNRDYGYVVLESQNYNGYYVIGSTQKHAVLPTAYILKTNTEGLLEWWQYYGGPGTEYAYTASFDHDGDILVSGYSYEEGIIDAQVFLMKASAEDGDLIWYKNFGYLINEFVFDMVPTSDYAYVVVGNTNWVGNMPEKIIIMKFGEYDYGRINIAETDIGAAIDDFQSVQDTIIVDIEADVIVGISVWIDTVLHESTGDLIFTLAHNGLVDTIIKRVGSDGKNFLETKLYDASDLALIKGVAPFSRGYKPHNPLSIFSGMDPNGQWILEIEDMAANKSSLSTTGKLNAWGLELIVEGATGMKSTHIDHQNSFYLKENYPNPFGKETRIEFMISESNKVKLEVYDINGRKVDDLLNKRFPSGTHEITWQAKYFPEGVYLLKMTVLNKSLIQKIIINR